MRILSKYYGKIIICLFLGIIFVSLFSTLYRKQLNYILKTLNLFQQSEPLTELYFSNYTSLPHVIRKDQIITFNFTIHNLENDDMKYPYSVYLQTDNGSIEVDSNVITVRKNESATETESFSFQYPPTRTAIFVKLLNKNQSIHFWIDGNLTNETI